MSILERAAGKGSAPEASFDGYSDSTNDTSRAAKQHTDDLAAGQPRAAGSDKPDIKEKVTEQRFLPARQRGYDRVSVDAVQVDEARRGILDHKHVEALAASMGQIGLQHPIGICAESTEPDSPIHLVDGLHRLEAARLLGWDDIDVVFLDDMSEDDREIWQVDENLRRRQVSPAEESLLLERRAQAWERKQAAGRNPPASLPDGRAAGPQHVKGFAADTEQKTGIPKRRTNEARARAKAIPRIAELKGTSLDTKVELDALAKKTPEDQGELIDRAKGGEQVTARGRLTSRQGLSHGAGDGGDGRGRSADDEGEAGEDEHLHRGHEASAGNGRDVENAGGKVEPDGSEDYETNLKGFLALREAFKNATPSARRWFFNDRRDDLRLWAAAEGYEFVQRKPENEATNAGAVCGHADRLRHWGWSMTAATPRRRSTPPSTRRRP